MVNPLALDTQSSCVIPPRTVHYILPAMVLVRATDWNQRLVPRHLFLALSALRPPSTLYRNIASWRGPPMSSVDDVAGIFPHFFLLVFSSSCSSFASFFAFSFRFASFSWSDWMVRHAQQGDQDGEEDHVREIESVGFFGEGEGLVHDSCEERELFGLRNDHHPVKLAEQKEAETGDEEEKHCKNNAVQEAGGCDDLHGSARGQLRPWAGEG